MRTGECMKTEKIHKSVSIKICTSTGYEKDVKCEDKFREKAKIEERVNASTYFWTFEQAINIPKCLPRLSPDKWSGHFQPLDYKCRRIMRRNHFYKQSVSFLSMYLISRLVVPSVGEDVEFHVFISLFTRFLAVDAGVRYGLFTWIQVDENSTTELAL
ncbi:UNVERIFIED_CONTAM: hypothetical protein NCL1_35436 [Trichonephila clavipes]